MIKVHFGKTRFPWELSIKLPSIYTKTHECQSHQVSVIDRVFGVSFGHKRFVGFIVSGPIVIKESRAAFGRSEG